MFERRSPSNFHRKLTAGGVIAGLLISGCSGGSAARKSHSNVSESLPAPAEINPPAPRADPAIACWYETWGDWGQVNESEADMAKFAKRLGTTVAQVSQGDEAVVLCRSRLTPMEAHAQLPSVTVEDLPALECIAEDAAPEVATKKMLAQGFEPMAIICVSPGPGPEPSGLSS